MENFRFNLKTLMIVVAIVSLFCLQAMWYQRDLEKISDIESFSPPAGYVNIWRINHNEGLVSVGSNVKLQIILCQGNGTTIAEEYLGPGNHSIWVYWGGREQDFGFSANGRIHNIPFAKGASTESISARLGLGEEKTLATVKDVGTGKSSHVRLVVVKQKPPQRVDIPAPKLVESTTQNYSGVTYQWHRGQGSAIT